MPTFPAPGLRPASTTSSSSSFTSSTSNENATSRLPPPNAIDSRNLSSRRSSSSSSSSSRADAAPTILTARRARPPSLVTTFVFTPPRTDRAVSHHRSRPLATDRPAGAAGVRPVHARSLAIAPLHAFAPPARSLDDVLRFTRTATSPFGAIHPSTLRDVVESSDRSIEIEIEIDDETERNG